MRINWGPNWITRHLTKAPLLPIETPDWRKLTQRDNPSADNELEHQNEKI